MAVRLFYVDESYDDKKFCLSAIGLVHREWKECFAAVRQHRVVLKQNHGIFLRKEIHAREFVKGKGNIAPTMISRHTRCKIFKGLLELVASLPNVMLFNVCLDQGAHADIELTAWNRLLNKIERTLFEMEKRETLLRKKFVDEVTGKVAADLLEKASLRINAYKPRAIIFADEGNEIGITRIFRKMSIYNPVPSQFGSWSGGQKSKNIPLQRIIEDPVFRRSDQSYLIQLADCVSFALLKREVLPTPHVQKHGLHLMFEECLKSVCHKPACPSDPLGITRK